MQWHVLTFSELTTHTLYDLLKLRVDVFVVEQQCAYPELDEKDRHSETRHVLLRDDNGSLIAYSRILAPTVSYPEASIGRVAIAHAGRGKGLAFELMARSIDIAQACWPNQGIQIGAQDYLRQFYQKVGFIPCSEVYLEDGIPHLDMRYQLR